LCASSEQPIFTTRVHVFQIDPDTKKKWLPVSSQPVPVSFYHDTARGSYRIISLDGSKVRYVACHCKGKGAIPNAGHRRGCSSPFLRPL